MARDDVRFLLALKSAIEERPEFVYPDDWKDNSEDEAGTCQYVVKDTKGETIGRCLIGEALSRCGVPDEVLIEFNSVLYGGSDAKPADIVMRKLTSDGIMVFGDSVVGFATEVQWRQDTGSNWGFFVDAVQAHIDQRK